MKLLLDTHAFIWLNTQPSRLSTKVVELLSSGIHDVYLSMASPWEMQISYLSKLPLHHNDPFDRIIIAQALSENMTVISADSAFSQYQVPLIW